MHARILSHHGRQAWALDEHGTARLCVYKGRDFQPTANDAVTLDTSASPAVITELHDRRNQLIRSEAHRSKTLAANIDQALIVISGAPLFSDELLARMLCACAAEGVPVIVALNKADLADACEKARAQLAAFHDCLHLNQWQVLETSARPDDVKTNHVSNSAQGIDALHRLLSDKTTVIMGQSGMGKSSLLNVLVPGFNAQTREISEALQTGKHTTTAGQMVALGPAGWLIDTPGFQLYGLHHLSKSQLALGFPEWQAVHDRDGRCKYANCMHLNEPGCTIIQAAVQGTTSARRLALWQSLVQSI